MRHENTPFSYANLQQNPHQRGPMGRFAEPMNRSFHVLRNEQGADRGEGWKFHISVAAQDVPRAWDMVADYLLTNNIGPSKVVTPMAAQRFSDPGNRQAGKMITVYDFGGEVDWQRCMQDIESMLAHAGIRPGHQVAGDRSVSGSRYMSYRNDRGRDGEYIGSEALQHYSPQMRHNPGQWPEKFDRVQVHNPAAQQQQTVPLAQHWRPQRDQNDTPLMSLPLQGMVGREVDQLRHFFQNQGYAPEFRTSKSLGGDVMYVSGDDALRMRNAIARQTPNPPPAQNPQRGR